MNQSNLGRQDAWDTQNIWDAHYTLDTRTTGTPGTPKIVEIVGTPRALWTTGTPRIARIVGTPGALGTTGTPGTPALLYKRWKSPL